ncbi:hypothetical protein ABK040_006462 [Willaertia magna]
MFSEQIGNLKKKLTAQQKVMIYGAYGYTGELIVKLAKKFDLLKHCVLAGRQEQKIRELMDRNQIKQDQIFDISVFSLDVKDKSILDAEIKKVDLVILTAGPFIDTSEAIVESCLRSGVHYIDITGEFEVFENILQNENRKTIAKEKGLAILPLNDTFREKYENEEPTDLEMALRFYNMQASRGTTKTMIKSMSRDGFVERRNGKLEKQSAITLKDFDFGTSTEKHKKTITCSSVPWGDVSTAFVSTNIPNIRIYFAASLAQKLLARFWFLFFIFNLILHFPFVATILVKLVDYVMPKGIEEKYVGDVKVEIIGRVYNKSGKEVYGRVITCEPYKLTAESALLAALRILTGDVKEYGCITPSIAFGTDYITFFDKSSIMVEQHKL